METKKEIKKTREKTFNERFIEALAEMPDSLPMIDGRTGNQIYRYCPLPVILKHVRPVLTKHGFAMHTDWGIEDDKIYIYTMIEGKEGKTLTTSRAYLPLPELEGQNLLKAIGGIITYVRRYQVKSLLGIEVDEDLEDSEAPKKKPKINKPIPKEVSNEPSQENIDMQDYKNKLYGKIQEAIDKGYITKKAGENFTSAVEKGNQMGLLKPIEDVIDRQLKVGKIKEEIDDQEKQPPDKELDLY